MANNILLYGHNGSGNHGCEAIVRATSKIMREAIPNINITLATGGIEEDKKYGVNKIVNLVKERNKVSKLTVPYISAYLQLKLLKNELPSEMLSYRKTFNSIDSDTISFSIGGDNFCYPGYERFIMIHNMVREKAAKTVLWGCSVEPSKITEIMKKDFLNYDLIIARETLTYEALKSLGANVKLYPDPAFQLDCIKKDLPKGFIEGNTVGINISPMIMRNENIEGITMENYSELISYIIENTDMNIAMIPHVIWSDNNDDRIPCTELYNKYKHTNRVVMIEETNCEELKGYISRCRFFVGSRTHATIAAYSTCVPTIVIGYSVKAKGIAKDLFGTYDNYVLPVQNLKEKDEMIRTFKWFMENENNIKDHMNNCMDDYCKRSLDAAKEIKLMIENN